ncbi:hypothetical protein [Streptococcus gordonii]|uniref:hypothetical protein n=1 Tax=Streptococcus gordonii TaxID=1302 RepID=UPI0020009B97|nr:hypothetical protein [Streptococcus gordonii]
MTNIFKANKTVKRIKTLQKELHDSSLAYMLAQDIGFFPENKKGRIKAEAMHDFSHILKDVLDGKSLDEATDILLEAKEGEEEEQEEEKGEDGAI